MTLWRRVGAWIVRRPWVAFGGIALACTIAFPRVAAGSVGLLYLCGLAGVWLARAWPTWRVRDRVPARVAGWIAVAIVVVFACYVFWPVLGHARPWPRGDWGPQHAVLGDIVDRLRGLELAHWHPQIGTGDASLEVYPAFTYVLAGLVAIATNRTDDLSTVLLWVATAAHVAQAVGGARLALRFVPAPAAVAIGMLLLVDVGGVSSGGIVGTIQAGLVHTAVAHALTLAAVVSIVDAVQRPRLRTSISIWLFTALSVMAHPAALLSAGVVGLALAAAALVARDVPARRPLFALGHLAIGVALGAVVWLPLGERILLYGQHFSDALVHPAVWLGQLLATPMPLGSFHLVVYWGYAGALAALGSRRFAPVFVATIVLVMVVATSDLPYLGLDLAPSPSVARLGAERFNGLVRPFVFVAAGYLIAVLAGVVRAWWAGAPKRSIAVLGAVLGVAGGLGVRVGCQTAGMLVDTARIETSTTVPGTEPLVAWARDQMAALGPDRVGRAYFYNTNIYAMHLTAASGMPLFQIGPTPDVLLRERIEDLSPASLARFDVRWAITESPYGLGSIGDPATERKLGTFTVREFAGWDGRFARVERGGGRAITRRLDGDVVEVELVDTTEPALVALGTGYYPRWRAVDANGRELPVYAYPATPGGHLHVPAAWLRPGTTRFTADGPLPSDGHGRVPAIAALVLAVAIIVAWSRRATRWRALRAVARIRVRMRRYTRLVARIAAALAAAALVTWGIVASVAPAGALEVGTGVRASASVSFKRGDKPWSDCSYARTLGEFHCGDLAIVGDTTAAILNDEQPLWPFTTPAVFVKPTKQLSLSITIEVDRRLAGRYLVGTRGATAKVRVDGAPAFETDHQRSIDLADDDHHVAITADVPPGGMWIAFVREDTMLPARDEPVAPSTAP